MEYSKFREKTIKAESAYNIVPQNLHLDPDYSLRIGSTSAVTPTGLLVVLRLVPQPNVPGLPSFVVRWDDKQNTIDVDLEGNVSDQEAFKLERNGYKGHHPATVSVEPRVFRIDIQLPRRRVYEALLTCNVGRGVTIAETLQFRAELSAENTVNRANIYVTVLVVAHLFINIVHGAAHRELHVTLPPAGMLFVTVVILLGPLLALALLWTSQKRLGLLLLIVSMAASAVFGLYHHFLVPGADHVSAQPSGPAGIVFVVTAYLLFLTEALGAVLGLYFLRKKPSSAPV